MDLHKAQELCLELMNKYGLTKENGWTFEWSRSHNSAGRCVSYSKRSHFTHLKEYYGGVIKLSSFITPHHSYDEVLDTILHEIAHGLTPGHHHDHVWKRKAIEIGCNGRRCYDVKGDLADAREQASKVIGVCPKCKEKFFKTRMPKRNLWCKCTGRTFKQEEKIQFGYNHNVAASKVQTVPTRTYHELQHATAACHTSAVVTSFPNTLLNLPPDSYKKMLDKFELEFMPFIYNDRNLFEIIVRKAKLSNSWRTMNREVRRACDQYMSDTDRMTNKQFQEKWFYEGVMQNRITWGKNAPWI